MSSTTTYKPTTGWYNKSGASQSSAYHEVGEGGKEMYFTFPAVDTMVPGQDYTPKINKVTLTYYLYSSSAAIPITVGISSTNSYLKTFDWSTSFTTESAGKKTITYDITEVFTQALQQYGNDTTWYMYFYSSHGRVISICGSNYTKGSGFAPYITIEWEDGVSPALITSVTSNVTLGNVASINFAPVFETLWYKINITCVSVTQSLNPSSMDYTNSTGRLNYRMSVDKWAEAIQNSYSATCNVTVSTYTDQDCKSLLGSSSSTFTITLPSDDQPTVDLQITGKNLWNGFYIQGKSGCTLTVTGTASTGSSVKSCSISGPGFTTTSTVNNPLTKIIDVLNQTGTIEYTAKVTDGRATVSITDSIYVYPYSAPIINSFSANRQDGKPTNVDITYNVTCSNISGKNKITRLKIYKKSSGSSTWSLVETIEFTSAQQSTNPKNTKQIAGTYASEDSYDFKIEAFDTYGESSSAFSSLSSEFRIVNINAKKNSLSIGKLADVENLFDCTIPARFWKELTFGGRDDAGSLKTDTSNGRNIIYIQTGQNVDGGATMGLAINNANVYVENAANSGKVNLGDGNRLWNQLYAANSTISTSDRNSKTDITAMSGPQEQLFDKLKPVTYKLKNGTSGRTHYGFVSQDIEDSLTELNLTGKDFAGFCKDLRIDDDGNEVLDESGNKLYNYSLRYSEFIALNTYMIQKLQAENKELKSEIQELKEMIATSSNNVE